MTTNTTDTEYSKLLELMANVSLTESEQQTIVEKYKTIGFDNAKLILGLIAENKGLKAEKKETNSKIEKIIKPSKLEPISSPSKFARGSKISNNCKNENIFIPGFYYPLYEPYLPEPAEIYSQAIAGFKEKVNDYIDTEDDRKQMVYKILMDETNGNFTYQYENDLVLVFHNFLQVVRETCGKHNNEKNYNYFHYTSVNVGKSVKTASYTLNKNNVYSQNTRPIPLTEILSGSQPDIQICAVDKNDDTIKYDNNVPIVVPEIIVKVKRQRQSTQSEPLVEAVAYYHNKSVYYLNESANVCNRCNPSLILILEGSYLSIYGCVTSLESKIGKDKDDNPIKIYDKTLTIATSCLSVMDLSPINWYSEDINKFSSTILAILDTLEELVQEKKQKEIFSGYYPDSLLCNKDFQIAKTGRIPNKLVYFNGKYVWKFSKHYGIDGHKKAVELGIAPKFESFNCSGGWLLIRMDKIKGKYLSDNDIQHNVEEWNKFVDNVTLFNKEFFHGDIRPVNILVDSKGKYYLLDYDWCDYINSIRYYPYTLNSKEFTKCGKKSIKPCSRIKPEHDACQLEYLTETFITNKTSIYT